MLQFRRAVEAMDLDALEACLAEDVEFRSPMVHQPFHGRATVGALLRKVARVFEGFHYVAEFADGDQTALVFKARIGNRDLDGIDLIRVDAASGLISHLTVFIRPMSGLQALGTAVTASLASAS